MTSEVVRIAPRFRGPAQSGNGGYVAGTVGTALARVAGDLVPQVRLLLPPPLDTTLSLTTTPETAVLADGGTLVASATAVDAGVLADAAIDPVSADEARAAESSYRGLSNHPFPGCFVCGPENAEGLQLRPGPIGDDRTACTWTPAADLAAADGLVDPVYLWSALDCPGGWSIDLDGRPSVLGQMTACVDARPTPGDPCVIIGRLLSEDGRKTHTATTLYDPDGRVLARAHHTWILVDPALFN
ncbi:hypothetical protein [Kribbella sp. NPDC006257]|uniref:hypothetical protein n=1 Tax=Kribbella sp. NPDC006257 TaxID=3156738 RepID=UPI0033A10A43